MGFVKMTGVTIDPLSVLESMNTVPKPAKMDTTAEGLPLDMRGSSIAVSILAPDELKAAVASQRPPAPKETKPAAATADASATNAEANTGVPSPTPPPEAETEKKADAPEGGKPSDSHGGEAEDDVDPTPLPPTAGDAAEQVPVKPATPSGDDPEYEANTIIDDDNLYSSINDADPNYGTMFDPPTAAAEGEQVPPAVAPRASGRGPPKPAQADHDDGAIYESLDGASSRNSKRLSEADDSIYEVMDRAGPPTPSRAPKLPPKVGGLREVGQEGPKMWREDVGLKPPAPPFFLSKQRRRSAARSNTPPHTTFIPRTCIFRENCRLFPSRRPSRRRRTSHLPTTTMPTQMGGRREPMR